MHTRVDAGQSVVNAGLSGVDDAGQSRRRRRRTVPAYEACMQGVDVGKSSVDERMQPARRLHKAIYAACMSIVKYA